MHALNSGDMYETSVEKPLPTKDALLLSLATAEQEASQSDSRLNGFVGAAANQIRLQIDGAFEKGLDWRTAQTLQQLIGKVGHSAKQLMKGERSTRQFTGSRSSVGTLREKEAKKR